MLRHISPLLLILGVGLSVRAQEDPKQPVPDDASQKRALKEIKEVFKQEYAKRNDEGRWALATKLFDQATQSQNDLASTFVLLREASTLGADAGDITTAFAAIARIEQVFDLSKSPKLDSPVEMKLLVLAKAGRKPDAVRSVATGYLKVAREAASVGDFKSALDGAKRASAFSRKARDKGLVSEATALSKAIPDLKEEFTAASKVDLTAAIDIGAKKSNLDVGRYLCFVKDDWEKGLEYLSWCDQKSLAETAKKELAGLSSSAEQYEVAEGWKNLSKRERSTLHKKRYESRARHWYKAALAQSEGLLKVKIEKSLAGLPAESGGAGIDLLALVDPAKDAVGGSWSWKAGSPGAKQLHVAGTPRSRLEIPYQPPPEYDFQVVFVPESSKGEVGQIFAAGGKQTMWFMAGWDRSTSGFQLVDSKMANENSTTTKDLSLSAGRKYTSVIQVRRSGVKVYVDGKLVSEYRAIGKLTVPSFWALKNAQTIGVGANAPVNFVSARLIEVTGRGKRLR